MKDFFKASIILLLMHHTTSVFSQDFSKCHAFLKIDNVLIDHAIPIDSILILNFNTIDVILKIDNTIHECYSFNLFYQKENNNKEYQPYLQVIKNKQLDSGLKRELKMLKDGDIIYIENILFDIKQPKKMSSFLVKVENNRLDLGYCY
jgi:hypothetical protein